MASLGVWYVCSMPASIECGEGYVARVGGSGRLRLGRLAVDGNGGGFARCLALGFGVGYWETILGGGFTKAGV